VSGAVLSCDDCGTRQRIPLEDWRDALPGGQAPGRAGWGRNAKSLPRCPACVGKAAAEDAMAAERGPYLGLTRGGDETS